MHRGTIAIFLSFTASLALAGCATQSVGNTAPIPGTATTNATAPIRFDSNTLRLTHSERILARFDLLGITAGQVEAVTIRDCPVGENSLKLTTSIRTSGLARLVRSVQAEAHTTVQAADASPIKSLFEIVDGESRVTYDVDFSRGGFHYFRKKQTGETREETISVPDGLPAHDLQTAILLLRSWHPKVGDEGYFYVVSGRFLLKVDMIYHGLDVVTIDGASRPAVRVEGQAVRISALTDGKRDNEKRKVQIWFSDDARHVPLRVAAESTFGPIVFDLLEYDPHANAACSPDSSAVVPVSPPKSAENL